MLTSALNTDSITTELIQILNLHSPTVEREVRFQLENRSLIMDYVFEEDNTVYLVDVKKRVNVEAVAQFYVTMELVSPLSKLQEKKTVFMIAAQIVDPIALKLANRLGIKVLKISTAHLGLEKGGFTEPPKIKLTAEKAWLTIVTLLKFQPTSIYDVMKRSAVSYGEAHRVVSYLKTRDLILQNGNYVSISNFRPLVNAVFWERPLSSLVAKQLYIDVEPEEHIPPEISERLLESKIKYAFTGLYAYGKYSGGITTRMPLGLYVDVSNPSFHGFIDEFSYDKAKTPNLVVYKPDRDVFSNTLTVDGIQLVSREQLLLDLSGGDKIEIQYATELVNSFGRV